MDSGKMRTEILIRMIKLICQMDSGKMRKEEEQVRRTNSKNQKQKTARSKTW